jgi:hypothetical protein
MVFHVFMAVKCQDEWRILIRGSGVAGGCITRRCSLPLYLNSGIGFVTGQGQGVLGCDAVKSGRRVHTFKKAPSVFFCRQQMSQTFRVEASG